MATNASPFIVNIVDLQNIATGISGKSKDAQLTQIQSDIGNIQEMVNYETKTLSADILTSFTQGHTIDVMANLNLSNASLYRNSNLFSLSSTTVVTTLNTIGGANTGVSVNTLAETISFTTAGAEAFLMDSSGNGSFVNDLHVGGNVYTTTLIQSSDRELKKDSEPFTTTVESVLKLEPQRFKWRSNQSSDLGFIAQDVQTVWPELTETHPNGTAGLVYSRFIPLLVESIRELNARIVSLESKERIRDLNDRIVSLESSEYICDLNGRLISLESTVKDYLSRNPTSLSNGSTGWDESMGDWTI